jgi:hypothetical protein
VKRWREDGYPADHSTITEIFAVSDVPQRKTDYVGGKYEIAASAGETTVAVKVIDMLGEEVIVTQKVSV